MSSLSKFRTFNHSKIIHGASRAYFRKTTEVASWMRSTPRRIHSSLPLLSRSLEPANSDHLGLHRAKAIWDFEGIFCSSRHIPGVRFAGLIHPGILGCAPSPEILAEWNKREGELIST